MAEKRFSEILREARANKDLTREELATITGLSVNELLKLENDRTKKPRPVTLELLATALDLDVNETLKRFGYSAKKE